MALVSADVDLLETFRGILELTNPICSHPPGRLGLRAHRIQFGDRLFFDWLGSIGLTPRKTYTIGALSIPEEFFRDFLRGHLDGDGSIVVYVDQHQTRLKAEYVYQRLYVTFISVSRAHVEWLRERIGTLLGVEGHVTSHRGPLAKAPLISLRFAKREAISLLRWIYYAPDVPCLARKRAIADPFLVGDIREFRHPPGMKVREAPARYRSEASGRTEPPSPRPRVIGELFRYCAV